MKNNLTTDRNMLYSTSKGGGKDESKGRKRKMQKVRTFMDPSTKRDPDLSKVQESVFRSGKGIKMNIRVKLENCFGIFLTRKIQIHHIDLNPKNNKIENLIMVRTAAHKKIHVAIRKEYGYALKNRINLQRYLREIGEPRKIWLKLCIVFLLCAGPGYAESIITEASYYTVASCMKESGQAIMANGRALDDNKLTAASWDYDFGTRLILRNMSAGPGFGREITVTITDRGPAKRLYRKGRRIDLSRAAFIGLEGSLRKGIITVQIEEESK